MLNPKDKVGIVCCSNGISTSAQITITQLNNTLQKIGLVPIFSNYIYEKNSVFSGMPRKGHKPLWSFI